MNVSLARLHRLARRLLRREEGLAAVEFALVAPFLLSLLFGTFQLSQYLVANQRVEKMAFTITDAISRDQMITAGMASELFQATGQLMEPLSFGTNGVVVLSAIQRGDTDYPSYGKITWQCEGGGSLAKTSKFGKVGDYVPKLPGGLDLEKKDAVIIAEVFYRYVPTVSLLSFGERDIYKYALFRPRLGQLTSAAGC
ncbi:TadE/TadG family type IV pilus assembly protein [Afifella sp. IM 167]|uniref:TadE/TadG family type IV pilus assembly protein n=1 Tax=Afifella sp. IM 167 TaxID=2033586 RepID=UPI001CCDDFCB|nr:TadE/TadG family type IV pilus assembly protein [Afifella sp. IM 167]MBZ8132772.1 hypothetical protein [Afifella sp. IM 167]